MPSVTSEMDALQASGFHVVRKHAAVSNRWWQVTTDPEIGTPVDQTLTVDVYCQLS